MILNPSEDVVGLYSNSDADNFIENKVLEYVNNNIDLANELDLQKSA